VAEVKSAVPTTDPVAEQKLVRVLSSGEIAARVRDLAGQLDRDYRGLRPVLVGVLKGAFIFLADLVREMNTPVEIDFLRMASYRGTATSARVRVLQGPARDMIQGRHAVLVEDIVDTGLSTAAAVRHLRRKRPASLKLCVLLDRPDRRRTPVQPDYLGFAVPGRFLVGYGLDIDQRCRHLPEVYAIDDA